MSTESSEMMISLKIHFIHVNGHFMLQNCNRWSQLNLNSFWTKETVQCWNFRSMQKLKDVEFTYNANMLISRSCVMAEMCFSLKRNFDFIRLHDHKDSHKCSCHQTVEVRVLSLDPSLKYCKSLYGFYSVHWQIKTLSDCTKHVYIYLE